VTESPTGLRSSRGVLAKQFREALAESEPSLGWLIGKRMLPDDIKWLLAHDLGAVPNSFESADLIRQAKSHLESDRDEAMESAPNDAVAAKIEKKYDEEAKRLETFARSLDKLHDPMWQNAVCYIYTDGRDQVVSVNVRQHMLEHPGSSKKIVFRVQPLLGKRGLFCPIPTPGAGWGDSSKILITEGEHNWLSLCRLSDEWSSDGRFALSGMAVGGKQGADLTAIKRFCDSERPVLLYDNDKVDPETKRPGGYALVEHVSRVTSMYAITTPTKDADDWVKSGDILPCHLRELIDKAKFIPQPCHAVAETIRDIRRDSKNKEWEVIEESAPILWRSIKERGLVYNAGTAAKSAQGIILWETETGRRVVDVSPKSPTWDSLMLEFGFEPSDPLCKHLASNIWARTRHCPQVKLSILSHYDMNSGVLYIDRGDGTMLGLRPDGTEKVFKNGDNSVVFLPHTVRLPEIKPVAGVGLCRKGGLFEKLISGTVRWDSEAGLNEEDQKLLLRVHFFQLFFDTCISMKMCPVFEGPGGAGNNTVTARIGRFLEGNTFSVHHMPKDERTLNEKSANRLYAGFDEYDSSNHEMESAFRSWCTTMTYETRKLYTEFDKAIAVLARGASLSTNYNPIKESATGRRQLTFFVATRDKASGYRSPAMDIWQEFDRKSDDLWSEVIADLMVIVNGLAEVPVLATSHSMADYAVFMKRCAVHEGWGEDCDRILQELDVLQQGVIADKSFWVEMVLRVLTRHPELVGTPHTATEWCDWMREATNILDRDTMSRINERKFGIYCTKSGATTMGLGAGMQLCGKRNNAQLYSFRPHYSKLGLESSGECDVMSNLTAEPFSGSVM
jgi:hypothetical protein